MGSDRDAGMLGQVSRWVGSNVLGGDLRCVILGRHEEKEMDSVRKGDLRMIKTNPPAVQGKSIGAQHS